MKASPVRDLETVEVDGCRFLSEPDLTYHDGGESRVLEILKGAVDLSSFSDEMVAKASIWPETYHLSPARANALRPLNLSVEDTVLEIGAGCGAITRYLGERCGAVDALEPMADRALCARERTRDLDNVEIFVGLLEDVPLAEAYDIVVIMGVLEYVGRGSADTSIYASFLERATRLLRPGGTLVLGIENRLGVKYLVGAPEDHSGRSFETIEGYDEASVARTFSRRELETLLMDCGLTVTTLGLFPDYKLARSVFHDELFEIAPHLATSIPHFPSPDWGNNGTRVASEPRAWRTLVDAGLGPQAANSLLLLGQRDPVEESRWPASTLAAYYAPADWRSEYCLETRICREEGQMTIHRVRVKEGQSPAGFVEPDGPMIMVKGDDLRELMLRTTTDEELRCLLGAWRDALDEAIERGDPALLDLLPHNAVCTEDRAIVFVDSKWSSSGFDRGAILGRAVLNLAMWLAVQASPHRWELETVGELTTHLGALLDLDPLTGWLSEALRREASLQASTTIPGPEDVDFDAHVGRILTQLEGFLSTRLHALRGVSPAGLVEEAARLKSNVADAESRVADAESRVADAESRVADAESRVEVLEEQRDTAQQEVQAIYATRLWRWTARSRSVYRRLRTDTPGA